MKLSTILVLSFILMGLVGSLAGTYYYYTQSERLLEDRIVSDLESTAAALENFINNVLEEQEDKIKIAATHGDLAIEELKIIRDLQEEFYEVFVLDSNGIVLACSEEGHKGLDKSNDDYFINARTETYLKPAYFSESTQKPSIAVSTPFHEGVLVAKIELQSFNKIVSDRTGLGETGEALLAYKGDDGYAVFFTERRFTDSSGTGTGILPMNFALAGEEKVIFDSLDYRGVEVVAVTRYIELIDVGLVVKIDKAEALGIARNQLIKTSIIIIIIISIFFSIVGFILSRLISKPIKRLTQDVDEITKGKLDIQLPKSNILEIQGLTDSLNRILASLKLAILRTGSSREELGLGEAVKQKEEAEKKYKSLFEKAVWAIIIADPTTKKFIDANQTAENLLGYSKEELEKLDVSKIHPKEDLKKTLIGFEKQIKGELNKVETNILTKSGKILPVDITSSLIKINGKDYLQGIFVPKFSAKKNPTNNDYKEIPKKTIITNKDSLKDKSKKNVVKRLVKTVESEDKKENQKSEEKPLKNKVEEKKYFLKK